ncbi:MAG: NAD-dependent epimerase/dehydratase family protein [Patulibacter sp.]
MRVVVLGATGNVGSALLRSLAGDDRIDEIVGFARRAPSFSVPKTVWVTGDIRTADLATLFDGAAAVVNLVWKIQPSRDRAETRSVNIDGTERVLDAVRRSKVPVLVHASSLAAYSPGPDDPLSRVDETWPTGGIASSFYARDKAAAERRLDALEAELPSLRVVRLRPGMIFQRSAAEQIRRYFLGPFWPSPLVRPGFVPVAPVPRDVRAQVVHADDVAEAYRMAIVSPQMVGAYNVAAPDPLSPRMIAETLGGLPLPISSRQLRAIADLTWKARLQPTPPGWVDLAALSPLMDCSRLTALGWTARHDGQSTFRELLDGLRDQAGGPTPPLLPGGRTEQIRTGVGGD